MIDWAIRATASFRSRRSSGGRLSVLMFHRILDRPDMTLTAEPDQRKFDEILGWLKEWFVVLPLQRCVELLKSGDLPPRALAITFDDGYKDNVTLALPVLQKHKMTATFFIASGYLEGGCMWNDRIVEGIRWTKKTQLDVSDLGLGKLEVKHPEQKRGAITLLTRHCKYLPQEERERQALEIAIRLGVAEPKDLMMSASEVRALHCEGMTIGGHTVTHPTLAKLTEDAARKEIAANKSFLEGVIDAPVKLFAYPTGKLDKDFSLRDRQLVEQLGFSAAVTTHAGAATMGTDQYLIPRFTPWDRTKARFGMRMLQNLK